MAKKKEAFNFHEVFEQHPIKSCIGCFITGVGVTYTILSFLYEEKIQNIKDRYDDKIELLNKAHEQDLEIKEIKLAREEGTNYYLNVKPDSKLAKDLSKLINNEKK